MRELATWACIGRAFKAQTSPTLWHSIDCTLPGSLICGIFHWSGLPFCLPGNLSGPGINLHLPPFLHWQVDSLPLSHLGISKTEGTAIEKAVWKKQTCLVVSRKSAGNWDAAGTEGNKRCVCAHSGGDDQLRLCAPWWELQLGFHSERQEPLRRFGHRRETMRFTQRDSWYHIPPPVFRKADG